MHFILIYILVGLHFWFIYLIMVSMIKHYSQLYIKKTFIQPILYGKTKMKSRIYNFLTISLTFHIYFFCHKTWPKIPKKYYLLMTRPWFFSQGPLPSPLAGYNSWLLQTLPTAHFSIVYGNSTKQYPATLTQI